MKPRRRSRGWQRLHILRQKAEDHTGKNITAPCRRQVRGRIRVYCGATVGRRDHRVGTLEQNYRAALLGCAARTLQFAAGRVEETREFAGLRDDVRGKKTV